MVAGQTNTGENIRCITHTLTGTHIQKGSLTITKKGVIIKRRIKMWCVKTNEYNDTLVNIFILM
jgi:hypothetical protein